MSFCEGTGKEGTDAEGMLKIAVPVDLCKLAQGQEATFSIKVPKDFMGFPDEKIYFGIEDPVTGMQDVSPAMKAKMKGRLSLLWQE